MLRYVALRNVTLRYVMLCNVMLRYVTFTLRYVVNRFILSHLKTGALSLLLSEKNRNK